MRKINLAVIHCTATEEGINYVVADIRRWHLARGFSDIGYHFLIHLDGTIERGRPIEMPGAHAKGYNTKSIGICYVGGLNHDSEPADTRTVAQIHVLRAMVSVVRAMYPGIKVVGHRDLSVDLNGDGAISKNEWMKACPCFNMSEL